MRPDHIILYNNLIFWQLQYRLFPDYCSLFFPHGWWWFAITFHLNFSKAKVGWQSFWVNFKGCSGQLNKGHELFLPVIIAEKHSWWRGFCDDLFNMTKALESLLRCSRATFHLQWLLNNLNFIHSKDDISKICLYWMSSVDIYRKFSIDQGWFL